MKTYSNRFIRNTFMQIVFLLLPSLLGALDSRILQGQTTPRNSRPFQVALYSRVGETGELGFCGGSLIHPQWVITAAHCCFHDGEQVDRIQAVLGAHNLYDRYENGRRVVNVEHVEVHPEWDSDTFANDIALMRLANLIQLTDTIDVVRLPYLRVADFNFAGRGATVSGWGIATPDAPFISPILRSKQMTVMTDQLCNINYQHFLPDNIVCGFSNRGGTCKGDNGGPMTIVFTDSNDPNTEETILIGVTSVVQESGCNDSLPSVFTRVQRYLAWIGEITGIVIN
ncbi:brachyurin-like [Hyposmocoma kahamanoa]|uniref:brachyurin-like n=1 Tax=Hyposmocoma kahamanoa TaxID=1477025 RepID=UPI000E6D9FB3|nr:brachyurin-like [Hyposmocoma kahamanoa]